MPEDRLPDHTRFDPLCLILGWVWPGLGYARVGERRRGILVMMGILLLVIIGVLVGGVDVVDRQGDGLWFVPQILIGPLALAIDLLNVTFVKTGKIGSISIGHVNEIGTLYVALAGLMNLTAMIDSATRTDRRTPSNTDRRRPPREDNHDLVERRDSPRAEAAVNADEEVRA